MGQGFSPGHRWPNSMTIEPLPPHQVLSTCWNPSLRGGTAAGAHCSVSLYASVSWPVGMTSRAAHRVLSLTGAYFKCVSYVLTLLLSTPRGSCCHVPILKMRLLRLRDNVERRKRRQLGSSLYRVFLPGPHCTGTHLPALVTRLPCRPCGMGYNHSQSWGDSGQTCLNSGVGDSDNHVRC